MLPEFFYVPRWILRSALAAFGLSIVSCLAYFIFLFLGFDFHSGKLRMAGSLLIVMFGIGACFTTLALAVLFENFHRRRDHRYPYLAIGRAPWASASFGHAQAMGLIALSMGVWALGISLRFLGELVATL